MIETQARSPNDARRALIEAVPLLAAELVRINHANLPRDRRVAAFQALAGEAIRTHHPDLTSQGHLIPGRTTTLSVCRIPAQPRDGKPIALFLPGLLSWLPLAAVRALTLIDSFDVVLCELPGHGASGETADVSLQAFSAEIEALIDTALGRCPALTLVGESLGGLVALTLARRIPGKVRNVVLVDTPLQVTRPALAAWITDAWRQAGGKRFIGRICREIMGFDPETGVIGPPVLLHDLFTPAGFACIHLLGSDDPPFGLGSVVSDDDLSALRAINPSMVIPPRIGRAGHAVLLDNAEGARDALDRHLVRCG